MSGNESENFLSQDEIDALLAPVETAGETHIAGILRAVDAFAVCNGVESKPLQNIVERTLIVEFLEQTGGNVSKVARELNMPRRTLRGKIERYGIKREP